MTIASMVENGRRLAATLMVDTAVVTRGGAPAFDPSDGSYTPAAGTLIHEGVCRVRQPQAAAAPAIYGDIQVSKSLYLITFPHDAPPFEPDDIVTITDTDDPDLANRTFRIGTVPRMSLLLYRELICEAVV